MLNAIFFKAFLAPQIIKTHLHQICKILKFLALSYSGILSLTSYCSKMLEFFNIFFLFPSLTLSCVVPFFSSSLSLSPSQTTAFLSLSLSHSQTTIHSCFHLLEYHVHCKLKLSDNRCCKLHLRVSKILDETQTRTTSFRD